jgi:hypothetical protein
MTRHRLVLAVLVTVAGAVGCARFQPVVPLRAQSADVDVQLRYLRLGPFGELLFSARSDQTHVISEAWLTVATRAPCTGGAQVDDVHVDGHSWVLPAGEHEIAVWPTSGTLEFSLDTVVDMQADDICIRVPAVSQSLPLEAARRPALMSTLDVIFAPTSSGLRALVGVEVGAGQWVGPIQLSAQVGLAGAICQDWACGRDAQGNLRTGSAIPMSLAARYGLATAAVRRLVSAFFLDARYTVAPFWLPLADGEQRFTAQSLFAEIGWGFLEMPPGPFIHIERAIPLELAVPLGVTLQTGRGGPQAVFSGGLTLRYILPL